MYEFSLNIFLNKKFFDGYCLGVEVGMCKGHPQVARQGMLFGHIATSILGYYILGYTTG